jgi:signal transduction histidine kinase
VLVVAVPVTSSERVIGVVRAASSSGEVRSRVWGAWAAMAGVAVLACACASVFAAVQARRLARPLQRLEAVAEDLGAGDFTSRAEPSGVGEIDRTGQALNRTAQRLDDMVARERAFTARASHQLRTPLTRLRLGLDAALHDRGDLRAAAQEAIVSADQLSRTIDDVLAVSRGTPEGGAPLDVAALLADLRGRWHGPLAAAGRPLTVVDEQHLPTAASEPAVRQILEVLVDNAYRHGRGRVTVRARDGGGAVAVDVVDEGKAPGTRSLVPVLADGMPDMGGTHRLGLRMAQSLADGVGGRLLHAHTEAHTRLTLLLPARPE